MVSDELMLKVENVSKVYKLGEIGGTTLRDELQRESGYYDTFEDTIVLDLSHCNTVDEKVDIVYNAIKNRS